MAPYCVASPEDSTLTLLSYGLKSWSKEVIPLEILLLFPQEPREISKKIGPSVEELSNGLSSMVIRLTFEKIDEFLAIHP